MLERYDIKIKAAYLVSAPVGVRPIKNWEGDQPFIGKPFDWETIRSRAEAFYVFHSDNDPYVSLGNGQEAAKQLHIDLTFVSGAGHFNKATGYVQFPLLLEKIKQSVQQPKDI